MEKTPEKYKLRIPDDDLSNWMQILRDGGMTDAEINAIFCKTNKTWLEAKLPEMVEKELDKLHEQTRKRNGVGLFGEEREYFRKAIEQGFREGSRSPGH